MSQTIEITPYKIPVEFTINGERLIAHIIDGSLKDPDPRALFDNEHKTTITLHFRGKEAIRAREVLAKLMNR